jgi:hypothetical protein
VVCKQKKGGEIIMAREESKNGIWVTTAILVIIVLGALTIWSGKQFDQYTFNKVTKESIIALLTSLFIIAVFVERGLEIFVTAWRGIGHSEIDARISKERAREKRAKEKSSSAEQTRAFNRRLKIQAKLDAYKAKTRKIAFLSSLSAGIVISVAGVRVLHPLLNWDIENTGAQQAIFNIVDIVITGGLIGGGSDGIHKILSVILDFLDWTRSNIKTAGSNIADKKS